MRHGPPPTPTRRATGPKSCSLTRPTLPLTSPPHPLSQVLGEVDGKPWEVDASELIERLKGRGRAASDATVVEVRAVRTPARCADSARNASV